MPKLHCIMHIYNEEYMLPHWINAHKDIFDSVTIIDYRSTDTSRAIIQEMAPKWEVVQSQNQYFNALDADFEVMKLEALLPANYIKMSLNVTEFLRVSDKQKLLDLLGAPNRAFQFKSWVSIEKNSDQQVVGTTFPDFGFWEDEFCFQLVPRKLRWMTSPTRFRLIHTHLTGAYTPGRHASHRPISGFIDRNIAFIDWWAFKPWGAAMLYRKTQFADKIPKSDKDFGFGQQHLGSSELYQNQYIYLKSRSKKFALKENKVRMFAASLVDKTVVRLFRLLASLRRLVGQGF